jgi:hypothetical protein
MAQGTLTPDYIHEVEALSQAMATRLKKFRVRHGDPETAQIAYAFTKVKPLVEDIRVLPGEDALLHYLNNNAELLPGLKELVEVYLRDTYLM